MTSRAVVFVALFFFGSMAWPQAEQPDIIVVADAFGDLRQPYDMEAHLKQVEEEFQAALFRAENGSADDAYNFFWDIMRANQGFRNRSNGQVLEDADPEQIFMSAYFLSKAAMLGHQHAANDREIMVTWTNAPDLATAYLADRENGSWQGFYEAFGEAGQVSFTAASFRALIAREIVQQNCNIDTVFENARGADGGAAIILSLTEARISAQGQTCVVNTMGREFSIGINDVHDMQCDDLSAASFQCSGIVTFSCQAVVTSTMSGLSPSAFENEMRATNLLGCGPILAQTAPISAAIKRDGTQFSLIGQ